MAGKRRVVELSKDLTPPWGRNRQQRQREKSRVPAGVYEAYPDRQSRCFVTGGLKLTGILTISLLNST